MKLNRPLQNQMQLQRRRAEMLTPEQAGAQQAVPLPSILGVEEDVASMN
jgi:hypothetical protein